MKTRTPFRHTRFKKWIIDQGEEKLSSVLDIRVNTIRHWVHDRALPKAEHMRKIVRLSQGRITYADIIEPYFQK